MIDTLINSSTTKHEIILNGVKSRIVRYFKIGARLPGLLRALGKNEINVFTLYLDFKRDRTFKVLTLSLNYRLFTFHIFVDIGHLYTKNIPKLDDTHSNHLGSPLPCQNPTLSKFVFKIIQKNIEKEREFQKSVKVLKKSKITYYYFVRYEDYNDGDMFCVDYYLTNKGGFTRMIPFTLLKSVNLENKRWDKFRTEPGPTYDPIPPIHDQKHVSTQSNNYITDDSVNNAFITLHSEFNKIGFISQVKDILSRFIYIYMKDTMIPNTVKPASMRLNYIFGNRPELLSLIFNKSNHAYAGYSKFRTSTADSLWKYFGVSPKKSFLKDEETCDNQTETCDNQTETFRIYSGNFGVNLDVNQRHGPSMTYNENEYHLQVNNVEYDDDYGDSIYLNANNGDIFIDT
ncbi:hypothetical protein RF11_15471 [Thelohanellus kitauei]|uniref:Uncharacterized protein n=1 Tax=Thelohanellus kitauei TaxID=669202 RepID=A0A0C2MES3_THEKT|nr:hypothetical protein RF11_15471 [Thelohanellus kitauei]